jgi:hypothetical protein
MTELLQLEDFASGEVADQLEVCVEEVVLWKFGALDPLDVAEDAVFDFSCVFRNREETQLDGTACFVDVLNAGDFVADASIDSDFFFQFAAQGVAGLLASFDFATGEFPLQGHGLVLRALADEELALAKDERSDHLADTACHFSHVWSRITLSLGLRRVDQLEIAEEHSRNACRRLRGGTA